MSIQRGAAVEAAVFAENAWWTVEAVEHLVGQTPWLTDETTNRKWQVIITRAWKHDGMICVRMEPYDAEAGR